ncbi:MAG: urease accessory protein UreG [Nitrososphaerales archaeon]
MDSKNVSRLGIAGPVGSGKTMLIEQMIPRLVTKGYKPAIISNDVISKEDAARIRSRLSMEKKVIPEDLVIGIATGGCPHTAIREDPSMNIAVINELESKYNDLDLIVIESGGDNITTTFSPALADYFIYIIDVAGGDKYPRKGGLGITSCDLLLINKIDLAPYVGADLNVMENDARAIRGKKPFMFVNCKTGEGIDDVVKCVIHDLLFDFPPKNVLRKETRNV